MTPLLITALVFACIFAYGFVAGYTYRLAVRAGIGVEVTKYQYLPNDVDAAVAVCLAAAWPVGLGVIVGIKWFSDTVEDPRRDARTGVER